MHDWLALRTPTRCRRNNEVPTRACADSSVAHHSVCLPRPPQVCEHSAHCDQLDRTQLTGQSTVQLSDSRRSLLRPNWGTQEVRAKSEGKGRRRREKRRRRRSHNSHCHYLWNTAKMKNRKWVLTNMKLPWVTLKVKLFSLALAIWLK